MTEIEAARRAPTTPRPAPPARRGPGADDGKFTAAELGLMALLAIAAALYVVLALRCPVPQLVPDEFRYSHLARSIADGEGMTWHGEPVDQSAALYMYLLAPVWRIFHSTTDAYAASKVVGTLALSTTAVPVWLLARELVGERLALWPAGLSVAGTWMLASAMTITEVLAYPLSTACLCATVLALRRRRDRLALLALVLALLATWARIQLVVLVPVVVGGVAADVLGSGRRWRETARGYRGILAAGAALLLVLVVVALGDRSAIGDYGGLYGWRPSLSALGRKSGLQMLELVVLAGFVPVLLATVAGLTPRCWRDARTRPLLIVFWLSTAALVAQSGWYGAGAGAAVPYGIERYVAYAAPLAFVLLTVLTSTSGLLPRRAFAIAGLLALTLLAMPAVSLIGIEPATWSTSYRVGQLTGFGHGRALALAAVVALSLAWLAVRHLDHGRAAPAAIGAVVLAALALQGQASWHHLVTVTRSIRAQLPADAAWVDHHTSAPVMLFGVESTSAMFGHLEFFNRSIAGVLVRAGTAPDGPGLLGGLCQWEAETSGELRFGCPGLARTPTDFLVNDPRAHVRFYNEISTARHPRVGEIVSVARGTRPRLRSIVVTPCNGVTTPFYSPTEPVILPAEAPEACHPTLEAFFWLDRRATAVFRFRGGRRDQSLTMNGRTWALPAGRTTTVRLRVRRGVSSRAWQTDWPSTDGAPQLLSAELDDRDHRISLM